MKDISEDNRCPNCGAPDLKIGAFCQFCETFRESKERFISVGEDDYPKVRSSFYEIEEEDVLISEENIQLKKKQQNIVAALILIIIFQVAWLFLR